ncbi:hypothetical protein BC332_15976 [Capsicum chinense]|nr:hypothetical protein BC332_15976 [Capsicum chinense]
MRNGTNMIFPHSLFTSDLSAPQDNYVSPSTIVDPSWYFDSGVSHHVNPDLTQLSMNSEYNEGDRLVFGNGMSLNISYISNKILSAKPKPITLSNALVVPKLTKSLLSIFKLTGDNNILVQFHANEYFVKNPQRQTILRGVVDDDLCRVIPSPTSNYTKPSPMAFLGERTTLAGWHHRLAHPNEVALRHLFSSYNLPV